MEIDSLLSIPESELSFVASRSSGPGGQNVNKVSSRITLRFDVAKSPSLNEEQRSRILERLGTRISGEGILQISSQSARSQSANRDRTIERFIELIGDALRVRPHRKKTRIPRKVKEKRLEEKKMLSLRKKTRKRVE